MAVEVLTCPQNSEEWYEARRGIVTASCFAKVLAKGEGKTRRSYMLELAGEIVTGKPNEGYSNDHMRRGHEMEPDARGQYAFEHRVKPELVGFVRNGRKGCSPDSLIGENGMLEIKTKIPALHIECLMRSDFPPEHRAQCQGALWVAEREWIDLAVYWPGLPLVVHRAVRDEAYIATLASEVERFNDELDAIVERVRRYGMRAAA